MLNKPCTDNISNLTSQGVKSVSNKYAFFISKKDITVQVALRGFIFIVVYSALLTTLISHKQMGNNGVMDYDNNLPPNSEVR